jgi:hypothetical protein
MVQLQFQSDNYNQKTPTRGSTNTLGLVEIQSKQKMTGKAMKKQSPMS